jgi:HK97 family phage prohead protease
MNEKKVLEFEIKDLTDDGRFSGYLSTFGNVDEGGDIVEPGAFKKTLREKKSFPLLWQHQGTLDGIVGTFSGREDQTGLHVDGEFMKDTKAGVTAHRTAKALIARGIRLGLSMGYKAVKFEFDKIKDITVRRLKEVALHEGSLTLFPMNDQAMLINVKSGELIPVENLERWAKRQICQLAIELDRLQEIERKNVEAEAALAAFMRTVKNIEFRCAVLAGEILRK